MSFRTNYQALVSDGTIEADAAQAQAVEAYSALEARLADYDPRRKGALIDTTLPDYRELDDLMEA